MLNEFGFQFVSFDLLFPSFIRSLRFEFGFGSPVKTYRRVVVLSGSFFEFPLTCVLRYFRSLAQDFPCYMNTLPVEIVGSVRVFPATNIKKIKSSNAASIDRGKTRYLIYVVMLGS